MRPVLHSYALRAYPVEHVFAFAAADGWPAVELSAWHFDLDAHKVHADVRHAAEFARRDGVEIHCTNYWAEFTAADESERRHWVETVYNVIDASLAHHRGFKRTPDLAESEQRFALEPQHGGRMPFGRRHAGRKEGAGAAFAADQSQPFPAVQRFANGRAADAEAFRQRDLRRQSVADLETRVFDHIGQRVEHSDVARLGVDPRQLTDGAAPSL